jgi:hypothetical protein
MNEEPAVTAPATETQPIPFTIIRTETVLSKLPIHHLAKKGNIDISITRRDRRGDLKLKWEVTYANRYGQPGQLAYKLDTLLINRRIDEAGRPLPLYLPLGSLRDIARELDLGGDTQKVKKALRQNAGAFISAKLTYKTAEGTEKILEADFNRYGMIFLGEKLPDGRRADQVYVTFNEPYREVLNNAPVRPLDYDYLKRLPPSPQRFYEILSYRIFAAIKFRHTEAKLPYSEYCTFSAQQRYSDYEPFRKQMYKVQRPHLMSGYLASFRYEETKDEEGKRDWIMYYEPGPRARAEYRSFTGDKQRIVEAAPALTGAGETTSARPIRRARARQHRLNLQLTSKEPPEGPINPDHLAALTSRGVLESEARKHLAHLPPGFPLMDTLEYGDLQVKLGNINKNPAGYYAKLVRDRESPPTTYETRGQRQAREDAEWQRQRERGEAQRLQDAYDEYRKQEIEHYIAEELTTEGRDKLIRLELDECRRKYPDLPKGTIDEMVLRGVRQRIGEHIKLLTFEEFREREQPGSAPKPSSARRI